MFSLHDEEQQPKNFIINIYQRKSQLPKIKHREMLVAHKFTLDHIQ